MKFLLLVSILGLLACNFSQVSCILYCYNVNNATLLNAVGGSLLCSGDEGYCGVKFYFLSLKYICFNKRCFFLSEINSYHW